jgi:adenylosuccinate synthase
MINGIDQLAVTNLDGLDTVAKIKMCIAYKADGKTYETMPNDLDVLKRCKPVYIEFDGWLSDTSDAREFGELPRRTRAYLNKLAVLTGAKLSIVSVGPRREQTMFVS